MEEVLIVGAGPTGLLLACELARHGVVPRVIEKRSRPSEGSRALALFARSLEILEDLGLAEAALARGRRLRGGSFYAERRRLAHVDMAELDSSYPFALCLPQSETERLLEQRAESLGVQVERGLSLVGLEQDAEGVTASLLEDGGQELVCRARWIVGCDGMHSSVRHEAGLAFDSLRLETRFAYADAEAKLDLDPHETHSFFGDGGLALALPLPEPSRWRIAIDLDPQVDVPDRLPPRFFERVFEERAQMSLQLVDPIVTGLLAVQQRKVLQFRTGRVFLAGDAAASHNPVSGQGINAGLQDAYNLAWKLALVLRGIGRSELLDSYHAEREPVARSILAAAEWTSRVVALQHPIPQGIRNGLASLLGSSEVVQRRIASSLADLSLDYRGSPIIDEHQASPLGGVLRRDEAAERPGLRGWFDFSMGPRAGDRAPDAPVDGPQGPVRLQRLLQGGRHGLLAFAGVGQAEGAGKLESLLREVQQRYSHRIVAYRVLAAAPSAPPGEDVLLDTGGICHHRYGAQGGGLYLVRPDGYIGFRCQPADAVRLRAHLARIFH